ncbi:hypoxanthine phosphoribosyltransferase [bacterium]|nr:hypoxanthine phosphoribosyltransferase [bacterium]
MKIPEKILFSKEQIENRIRELVSSIAEDFRDREIVIVGILKGSFIFLADLVRLMYEYNIHPQVDFMILSSYGGSTYPSTMVKIERDLSISVEGKAVLVVDDILDTGRTMQYVKERLRWLEPEIVRTCVLLDKPARRIVDITPDYTGFQIEDEFVVGFGLDYNGFHREKPYIAVIQNPESAD